MAKPLWHHMLEESKRQALRAMDAYNSSTGSFGDFVGYMHRAWLYLLHAEFRRDGVDFHYVDEKTGKYVTVAGEPKAWELGRCLQHRFSNPNDPVRRNIEIFIELRNKMEHRYERALQITTGGKAHALVINYEAERASAFGPSYSLADQLRFPVFLQSLTESGATEAHKLTRRLPKKTSAFIAQFESGLDPKLLRINDMTFESALFPSPAQRPMQTSQLTSLT